MATLYHWDLPQPLEDEGGWANRDTAARLAEYAQVVHERLGDRVSVWATLNEPWCSAFLGYAAGIHAPGRKEPDAAYAAAHHLLLGHALAARAVREADSTADVGIVLNLNPVYLDAPGAEEARDVIDGIQNGLWLGALIDGAYPEELRQATDVLWNPDVVREGDLAAISGSLDWLGVNFYTPARIAPPQEGADAAAVGQATAAYPGAPACSFAPREPKTEMGWEIDPSAFEELLVDVSRRARGLPIAVTENGAAFADEKRAGDGSVEDQDRIAYLADHIAAVERAREAGADVRAYVAWTLLDNFEWAEGYTKKFGLVEIEDGTQRRVPKASFRWYAQQVGKGREQQG